jgi:hypothetical protein
MTFQSEMKPDAGQLNHIASGAIHSKTKEVELTSRKLIKVPFWQVEKKIFSPAFTNILSPEHRGKKTGIAHGYFKYVLS